MIHDNYYVIGDYIMTINQAMEKSSNEKIRGNASWTCDYASVGFCQNGIAGIASYGTPKRIIVGKFSYNINININRVQVVGSEFMTRNRIKKAKKIAKKLGLVAVDNYLDL